MDKSGKVAKRKLPFDDNEPNINWEKKYQELLEWVDRGESNLIEWTKDEEPETEVGDIHLILDYGRKRKKKGRKNSLWESSERRKAKSKPDCAIRIEYRVPKDIATLESEGFDREDIESFHRRCNLRPRVISWMKDKGIDGPIRKLVHTVEKKSLANSARTAASSLPSSPLSSPASSPVHSFGAIPPAPRNASCAQLTGVKPTAGSPKGGELVKIFGANFTGDTKVYWNQIQIDHVCKSSREIWCSSLPGVPGTSAAIFVENAEGRSQVLPFGYPTSPGLETIDAKVNYLEEKVRTFEKVARLREEPRALLPNFANEIHGMRARATGFQQSTDAQEMDLERVAASLASLGGKDPSMVVGLLPHPSQTKMVCRNCRKELCSNCPDVLAFIDKGGLSLCSRPNMELPSLVLKGNGVHCKSCESPVGLRGQTGLGTPFVKFANSQVLFERRPGDLFGDQQIESLRRKLPEIPEATEERPQPVALPNSFPILPTISQPTNPQPSKASIRALLHEGPASRDNHFEDWLKKYDVSGSCVANKLPTLNPLLSACLSAPIVNL